MIDLSKIEVRRGMAAMVVGVLVVAAVAVSACGGEEEKKENYKITYIYGEKMILDTRNGNVSVIGKDTTYLLAREPRASIFQRKRGRYKFWGDGNHYIFDTYKGELYEIDWDYGRNNENRRYISNGIVRRMGSHKKEMDKKEDWRGL